MLKKVGELKVDTSRDYRGEIANALIVCGFTLIMNYKSGFMIQYDIAIEEAANEQRTESR